MQLVKIASAIFVLSAGLVSADPKKIAPKTPGASYIPNAYTVEFEAGSSFAAGGNAASVLQELTAAHPAKYNKKTAVKSTEIKNRLFHGATFHLGKNSDPKDLAKLQGVKKVYPVKIIKRPTVVKTSKKPSLKKAAKGAKADETPLDLTPHQMTGVAKVHATGHFGKGVKVAVIDTGVYWKHPALGGCFGPGCKISFGYDLVGDAYDADTNPIQNPDSDPMDNCSADSHGTHTTGTIGADATGITEAGFKPFAPFLGVAPSATLGHYRIFGCDGNNGDDVMANAIFRAYADGAQVISISVGEAGVVADESLTPRAIDLVTRAGVHVVVSAGNDGAGGLWTMGDPANAPNAYTIASINNQNVVGSAFVGPDGKQFLYAPASAGGWTTPVKAQIFQAAVDDGCASGTYPDAKGKVLLVKYNGQCKSGAICGSAAKQGAVGCLIYNVGGIAGSPLVPSGSIDDVASARLLKELKANPTGVYTFSSDKGIGPLATAGTASDFTSYGSDERLISKPDLAGVGGSIYSTVSKHAAEVAQTDSAYLVLSGTSMACPYVAGTVALLLEGRGALSVDQAKAIMQNAAKPAKIFNTTLVETPLRVGAGLVDIASALASKTLVTPSFLALNDTKHTKKNYKLRVKNTGKKAVTYTLSNVGSALATGMEAGNDMPIPDINYTPDYATVKFSNDKVRLDAGKSADITVTFTAPKNANKNLLPFYGGYIKIASPTETLSVPYQGLVGDFSKAKMIVEKNPVSNLVAGVYNADDELIPAKGAKLNATAGINVKLVLGQSTRMVMVEVLTGGARIPGTPIGNSLGVLVPVPADQKNTPYSFTVAAIRPYQPRNVQLPGQGYKPSYDLPWFGTVTPAPAPGTMDTPRQSGNNTVQYTVPAGKYQIRFSALRHFGDAAKASDYETVLSPVFDIFY
ncbi:hypothetical protein HDU86_006988 [Geranomyces michiganensis]|nr:hypothetical protein HDU86_006988 [Geranomyces michiganensis]